MDRLAFAALLLLACGFALEVLHPFITVGNWQFSNLETFQWVVLTLWLAARLLDDNLRGFPRWLVLSLVVWLAVLVASTFATAEFRTVVIVFDTRIVRGVLIAWITFDLARSPERWRRIIQAFALGGVVIYLAGLLEATKNPAVKHVLESMRGASIYVGDVLRISSTLPYPTIAAMCIEVTLFPLLAWFLATRRRWLRTLLGIGLLCGVAALALTFTRGGLIGLAAGLIVMALLALIYGYHRREVILAGGAVVMLTALVIGVLLVRNPALLLRFTSENGESWYRAAYSAPDQVSARPGEILSIPVTLTNTGARLWEAGGSQPFHLSYHLLRIYPVLRLGILYEGQRTALPHDVAPGESVTVTASVVTPIDAGSYTIRWDMVEENVTWFSTQNAPVAETPLTLAGDPVIAVEPFTQIPFGDNPQVPRPGRLALWSGALQMVKAHPLLGVGPDNFRYLYGRYTGVANWDMQTHANSIYFEWLADTGVVGLLAFLAFSGLLWRCAARNLRQHFHDPRWIWQLALIGSLTAWYVHGLVDYFYEFMPTNTAFWLLVGLAISLYRIGTQEPHPAD